MYQPSGSILPVMTTAETTKLVRPEKPSRLQTLDYTTLALVACELRERLLPGRVENVIQQDDFSLLLQMRCVDDFTWMLICWQPEAARVCLQRNGPNDSNRNSRGDGQSKRRGGGNGVSSTLYSLPGQLKGFLQLKTLINVTLPIPGERIMVFEFADRLTVSVPTHKLVVEVMGRRSNVMLVDGDTDIVLACGYQVSPLKSVRPVSIGQRYTYPPPLTAPLPPPLPEDQADMEAYESEFIRRITLVPSHSLPKALISAYRGFSPQLVDVMGSTVGIRNASTTPVGNLSRDVLVRFFRGPVVMWVRLIVMRDPRVVATSECGLSLDGKRYTPLVFHPGNGWQPVPSVLKLVEVYYTAFLKRQELRDLQRRGLNRVQAVQHRLQRTRQEFQRQLDAAAEEEVSKLQTKAELLTTYAYSWKQGDTECVCPDLDTGEEICIPLKPGKSAADEAQATYGRIRKLKRSVDAIMPLLQKIDVKVAYVDELESSIQQLGTSARSDEDTPNVLNTRTLSQDLAIMREIAEELGINCLDGRGGSSTTFFSTILNRLSVPGTEQSSLSNYQNSKNNKRKKKDKPVRDKNKKIQGKSTDGAKKCAQSMAIQSFRPPSVHSTSNVVVYVGRNSKQNDYVTFQLARDHELWFHAQGVPGAHCLMRIDPGVEVSDADMQFAADLAAYFSKARGSGQVPVIWTSPKYLKRVVGGGPGMVHVSKEKVLWGRPSRGEKIVLENDEDNNTMI